MACLEFVSGFDAVTHGPEVASTSDEVNVKVVVVVLLEGQGRYSDAVQVTWRR
jgi:hypothetical protein